MPQSRSLDFEQPHFDILGWYIWIFWLEYQEKIVDIGIYDNAHYYQSQWLDLKQCNFDI